MRTPYAAATLISFIVARLSAGCRRVISRFGMLSKNLFHFSVTTWFEEHFKAPTPAQADAWPLIKAGRNVLIAAPTGSGKTLAAFMAAIDDSSGRGSKAGSRTRPRSSMSLRSRRFPTISSGTSKRRSLASGRSFARQGARRRDSDVGAHRRYSGRASGSAWLGGRRTSS